MNFKEHNYWGLILGGSSGIGLATAKKLASVGMNVAVVHRDRKQAMTEIEKHFDEIRSYGVEFQSYNCNALSEEGRNEVLAGLSDVLNDGSIRIVLHSIALGNLKLLAPMAHDDSSLPNPLETLAAELGIDPKLMIEAATNLGNKGIFDFYGLTEPSPYNNERFLNDDDFTSTIYNMAISLVSWVQEIYRKRMFAKDARVIGLTSEGNEIAWRGYAAVSAAKTALESISRSIAVEMAPYGIRSNIVQPGVTDTPALRLIPGSEFLKASAMKRNPFKRITTPEDVANVISLLARDEASWINGSIIRVDGGEHISG